MPIFDFDAEQVEDMPSEFEVLPEGWYQARVTKSELKNTKAGNGKYLNFQVEILGPTHKGRVVFQRYTVVNPNETAVRIGQSQLKGLCQALGRNRVKQTEELHDQVFGAFLKVVPGKGQYGPSNEIKDYCSASAFADTLSEWQDKATNAVASGAKSLPSSGGAQPEKSPWEDDTSESFAADDGPL